MTRVTCPCCKGKKRLMVVENAAEFTNVPPDMVAAIVTYPDCTHCMGEGTVPAEVEEGE